MAKPKLNDLQKARVVELEQSGKVTQKQIAQYFSVSPRTITRVLTEAGLVDTFNHLTDHDKDSLKLIRDWGITVSQLKDKLATPPLTVPNVVHLVSSMDDEQLGGFLVSVTKIRIDREHREQRLRAEQARAQEGHMEQEALV